MGFYRVKKYDTNGSIVPNGVAAYISSHFGVDFFVRNNLAMRIDWQTQSVGIGTSRPSTNYKLHVKGNAYAEGGNWLGSDVKLKKNITDYTPGLSVVNQLHPVKHELKAEAEKLNASAKGTTQKKPKQYISVLAQELQQVAPELVDTYLDENGEETLAINQTGLIFLLVNSVKELNTKVEEQQAMIEQLQQEVNALKPKKEK